MELKDRLTTEKLRKQFKSQFELVNYSIKLAENMIRTGRDPRVKVDNQNRAMQVLEEIASGKDQFDEIPEPIPNAREIANNQNNESIKRFEEGKKKHDNLGKMSSKKNRNALAE
jgi:hypothetical protein